MSLNLNAALSSFIAASPRLIHHSKTLHWKKKKKNLFHWSRPKHYLCEPNILIVVVVARAGLFTVRQIREWATYVFIYFYFALRHRPLSLPQSPPHQCCAGAGSATPAGDKQVPTLRECYITHIQMDILNGALILNATNRDTQGERTEEVSSLAGHEQINLFLMEVQLSGKRLLHNYCMSHWCKRRKLKTLCWCFCAGQGGGD